MSDIIFTLFVVISSLIAITIHELFHGLVSFWLGDPTPKRQGRLSLNPMKHLDLFGVISLVLFHVGWAKPVMINPEYYRRKKLGIALTALAGPLINITMFFMSCLIFAIIFKFSTNLGNTFINYILVFFQAFAIVNLGLGLFNLIPIPPLDGSKILSSFLRGEAYEQYMKYERYGFIILFILLALSRFVNGNSSILSNVVVYIYEFIQNLLIRIL